MYTCTLGQILFVIIHFLWTENTYTKYKSEKSSTSSWLSPSSTTTAAAATRWGLFLCFIITFYVASINKHGAFQIKQKLYRLETWTYEKRVTKKGERRKEGRMLLVAKSGKQITYNNKRELLLSMSSIFLFVIICYLRFHPQSLLFFLDVAGNQLKYGSCCCFFYQLAPVLCQVNKHTYIYIHT